MNQRLLSAATLGGLVLLGLAAMDIHTHGTRPIGTIENIHGIPYPQTATGSWIITEPLAHTDLYLAESVFAKQATLTVTYRPHTATHLAVGIRENEFWLSYPRYTFYPHSLPESDIYTATLNIPLTDKLQSPDRSLDILFFANETTDDTPPETPANWELVDITVTIEPAMPTPAAVKDFARSLLTRERPL